MRKVKEIKNRAHPLWYAYVLHRLSGLGLAIFLPFHFWVLSLSLTAPERLDGFLKFSEEFIIKLAEYGLVFLLAVHMFGGLRLMAFEMFSWASLQKTLAALVVALAFFIATIFFVSGFIG